MQSLLLFYTAGLTSRPSHHLVLIVICLLAHELRMVHRNYIPCSHHAVLCACSLDMPQLHVVGLAVLDALCAEAVQLNYWTYVPDII